MSAGLLKEGKSSEDLEGYQILQPLAIRILPIEKYLYSSLTEHYLVYTYQKWAMVVEMWHSRNALIDPVGLSLSPTQWEKMEDGLKAIWL